MLFLIMKKYDLISRSITSQSRCSLEVNLRTMGAFGTSGNRLMPLDDEAPLPFVLLPATFEFDGEGETDGD